MKLIRMLCVLLSMGVLAAPALAQKAPDRVDMDAVLASVPAEHAARYERFRDFYIKGVCGTDDLQRLSGMGVNAIRGYTLSAGGETTELLDRAHALGMKVVLSEWMPSQGENRGNDGGKWSFDYGESGDNVVGKFIEKVDAIGDHPAILMWGLGNEVHLDEPYLRTVERMSRAVHERYPHHLTSLTMVNAKPEHIERIKRWAPDLDVIGVQSYSPGAVRGGIRNMNEHWGKPFYYSEFNGKGPWNFKKTEWGAAYDNLAPEKVSDLLACYEAIHSAPLCLGSTVFVWGSFGVNRPTYFSLLLDRDPTDKRAGTYVTPQAEVVADVFGGGIGGGNRAPVLERLEPADSGQDVTVPAGGSVELALAASDADGGEPRLEVWVLDDRRRPRAVAGPYVAGADGVVRFDAPKKAGAYLLMGYAVDGAGGASASTVPMLVTE